MLYLLLWLTRLSLRRSRLSLSRWTALLLLRLLLLLLLHVLLSGFLLLHLNKLWRCHAYFGSFLFDLLSLECLELWYCHAAFLCFHSHHLLNGLWSELLRYRSGRGPGGRHSGGMEDASLRRVLR